MNRLCGLILVLLVCFFLPFNTLKAQSLDDLRKQFPSEQAVLLNKTLEYNIDLKAGQPIVDSHENEQIEYLLGSATAYMGEYSFSQSDLRQLVSYAAYTRTADDK